MSEHTPGFYTLQKHRTRDTYKVAKLRVYYATKSTKKATRLLNLVQKYNSNQSTVGNIKNDIEKSQDSINAAQQFLEAADADYSYAKYKELISGEALVDAAEELAYMQLTATLKLR